jgi:site-specific recombinase XerC
VGSDSAWSAIYEVADRLNQGVGDSTLEVRASRRRSFLAWSVTEGIEVMDNWTDVFEPVRRRRLMSSKWQEIQPVEQAAANIRSFLRDRPDLL